MPERQLKERSQMHYSDLLNTEANIMYGFFGSPGSQWVYPSDNPADDYLVKIESPKLEPFELHINSNHKMSRDIFGIAQITDYFEKINTKYTENSRDDIWTLKFTKTYLKGSQVNHPIYYEFTHTAGIFWEGSYRMTYEETSSVAYIIW
jgi:hypothetical protein